MGGGEGAFAGVASLSPLETATWWDGETGGGCAI